MLLKNTNLRLEVDGVIGVPGSRDDSPSFPGVSSVGIGAVCEAAASAAGLGMEHRKKEHD